MSSFVRNTCAHALIICLCGSALVIAAKGEEPSLEVKSVLTYGGGSPRSARLIAGDIAYVAIAVTGLKTSNEADVQFEPQISLLDGDQNPLANGPPRICTTQFGLPTKQLVAIKIPEDTLPGQHLLRTLVRDRISGLTATSDVELTVDERSTFGALNMKLTRDAQGSQLAGGVFSVLDTAFLHLSICGFKTNDGMSNIRASVQITENGKSVVPPFVLIGKRKSDEAEPMSLFFEIPLRREGKFHLNVKLEDDVSSKSVSYSIPIIVIDPLSIVTK